MGSRDKGLKMTLAPFFDRIYGAIGMHLSVSRRSLSDSLSSIVVGVCCGSNLSPNEKTIAELTTNLLARLYPKIAILGNDNDTDELKALALRINPDIEFSDSAPGETSICIGGFSANGVLYPTSAGWIARLGHANPSDGGIENPYSASASAAFACSELFRRIFLHSPPEPDLSISLLDFESSVGKDLELAEESINDVLFVGAGAVGNAAIWAMARDKRTSGILTLLDHETLSLSNLQRYVLGEYSDISKIKVDMAAKALRHSRFVVSTYQSTLENFLPPQGWLQPPTTCVSVDNVNGRRVAQALLPRLVINGWTGERALGSSWHEFSNDAACLACLYQPQGPGLSATQQAARALGLSEERAAALWVTRAPLTDQERKKAAVVLGVKRAVLNPWRDKPLGELYTDVVCGAVPLDIGGVGRMEVVPLAHQSVLAGILMAAELIKRSQPTLRALAQPEPLVSWDDILRPPHKIWKKPRPREKGCICGDQMYQAVYRDKWLQV
jgi:ThiF family